MHPRRIPGSDVNLGLATAFVVALTLLLIFTDPSTPGTTSQWQEARPEAQEAPTLVETGLPTVETGLPTVEVRTEGDCDVAVS
jgi:hypothetical protein